jgi:hypothetical protein
MQAAVPCEYTSITGAKMEKLKTRRKAVEKVKQLTNALTES